MKTRLQLVMLFPGIWIIATCGWLYLSRPLGIEIHSNTASVTVLTWLIAAPLALLAGLFGIAFCIQNWKSTRLSIFYAIAHALFMLIATIVIIGILNLPDFGGQ